MLRFKVANMSCGGCARSVTKAIQSVDPAAVVEADLSARSAVVTTASPRAAIEGAIHKHLLSSGLGAMPIDSDGVPFDMSHIYASGNLAADMTANIAAESTGRVLAVRL